jgi:hypothetical protein
MPTNSDYDGFFAGIDGIPLFTYGMIASTILVLSYMTYMEEDMPEEVIEATGPESTFMTSLGTPSVAPASITEEIPPSFTEPIQEEVPPPSSVPEEEVPPPSVPEEEIPPPSAIDEVPPPSSVQEPEAKTGGKKKRNTIRKRSKLSI